LRRFWSRERPAPAGRTAVSASRARSDVAVGVDILPGPGAFSPTPRRLLRPPPFVHLRLWSRERLAPAGRTAVSAGRARSDVAVVADTLPGPGNAFPTPRRLLRPPPFAHPRLWSRERLAPAGRTAVRASRARCDAAVVVDTLPGPGNAFPTPRRLLRPTPCPHPWSWSRERLAPAGRTAVRASRARCDVAVVADTLPGLGAFSPTPRRLLRPTPCPHPRSWSRERLAPVGRTAVSASRARCDAAVGADTLPGPGAPSPTPRRLCMYVYAYIKVDIYVYVYIYVHN